MKKPYIAWLPAWATRPLAALGLLLAAAGTAHAQTPAATFASVTTFGVGTNSNPYSIAVADVNGDGKPDLLTANYGSNTAGVLLNTTPTASPRSFLPVATFGTGTNSAPFSIAVADVNGDGKPDLLTANLNSSTAGVLLGNGNGTFQAATTFGTGGSQPYSLAVADVNGDGKPDLLTANLNSNSAGVLLGNGNGTFQAATAFGTGSGSNPRSLAVADVNGDGKPDLLTANFGTSTAGVLLGTVLVAPVLTTINPTTGPVGSTFAIAGTNLTGATAITFTPGGGGAATTVSSGFTVASDGSITGVPVPAGLTGGTYTVTVTTPGGTSNGVAFVVIQDLVISTPGQTIAAGTYRTITITGPTTGGAGVGTLGGPVAVTGTVTVQAGGTLLTACQVLTGGAGSSFVLAAGGTLGICDAGGIAASGATGAIQTDTRSFASAATYLYNGTAAQVTGTGLPATVETLVVNATGPVQLTQAVGLTRELRLSTGVLNLNGQGLTLLSDATATAQVNQDGVTTTGTITGGSATVQRYILANGNAGLGYRHLSSPVSGNRLDDLAVPGGYQPVFNAAYNTSAASASVRPFPTVFGFDPARIGTAPSSYTGLDQGYYSPVTGTAPDLFVPGRGYTVQIAAGQTVDFVGSLNQTALTLPLVRAAGTASPDDGKGWNLLGNPFPSAFALSSLDNTPGLDDAKYIFQSTGPYTGFYQTVMTGLTGQPLLAPGQGFFARVSTPGTTPTITFALAGRRVDFSPSSTFHRPTTETRPLLELELATATGTLRDRTTLYADAQATTGLDAAFDAVKLSNPHGLNLSQPLPGTPLALAFNALPVFTAGTVVPLRVGVPAAGSYTLRVNQLLNLPAGTTAVLVDNELNTRTDLATLPATGYAFSVSATQAATALTARFWLNLVPAGTALASTSGQASAAIQLFPNPTRATATLTGTAPGTRVQVLDALGRAVLVAVADATGSAVLRLPAGLASGVYVVRAGTVARRLTVE